MLLLCLSATVLLLPVLIVLWLSAPHAPIQVVERATTAGAPLDMMARAQGCYLELGEEVATRRPFVLDEAMRFKSMVTVGPVGVGKTTLIENQLAQDVARRDAAVVAFDSQAALRDDITALCAAQTRDLVVYPDAGFNPLNAPGTPAERARLIADLLGQITGAPQPGTPAAHYLFQAKLFVRRILPLYERAYGQPMILRELALLAADDGVRSRLLQDAGICPEAVAYRETLGHWSSSEWAKNTEQLRGLVDELQIGDRAWLYNDRHATTLQEHIEAKRVLLIQEGGPPGTDDYLLGQLFVVALQEWIRKRNVRVSPHLVALHIDEAPNYLNAKTPFFINQCRQKRAAVNLGIQAFGQLAPHTTTLTTGARTWVIYGGLVYDDCLMVANQIGKRLHRVRTRSREDGTLWGRSQWSYQDRYLVAPHEIHSLPADHVLVLSVNGREVDGHRILRVPAFVPPPLTTAIPPAAVTTTSSMPPTVWEERGLAITGRTGMGRRHPTPRGPQPRPQPPVHPVGSAAAATAAFRFLDDDA